MSLAWNAFHRQRAVAGYYLYLNQHGVKLTGTSYTAYRLKSSQSVAVRIVAFDTSKNRSPATTATVSTAACRDLQAPKSPADGAYVRGAASGRSVLLGDEVRLRCPRHGRWESKEQFERFAQE